MEYRHNVESAVRQPDIEHNHLHVYVRWNFAKTIIPATELEPERIVWTYDEYYMTDSEYYAVCSGGFGGEWDDVLRSVERSYLYDHADKMISKYSTDVPDKPMRQAWIDYKHAVRATQEGEGYPAIVQYPDRPERS